MTHVYSPSNPQELLHIQCDYCEKKITPSENIACSGWRIKGFERGAGSNKIAKHQCPGHKENETEN